MWQGPGLRKCPAWVGYRSSRRALRWEWTQEWGEEGTALSSVGLSVQQRVERLANQGSGQDLGWDPLGFEGKTGPSGQRPSPWVCLRVAWHRDGETPRQ